MFFLICLTLIYYRVFAQALQINEFVGLNFCEEAVNQNASMSAENCSVNTGTLMWVGLLAVSTFFFLMLPKINSYFLLGYTFSLRGCWHYILYQIWIFILLMTKSCCFRCKGEEYLYYQGIKYTTWGLWENHVALSVMTVIFLIITYLKLRFIKKFTWMCVCECAGFTVFCMQNAEKGVSSASRLYTLNVSLVKLPAKTCIIWFLYYFLLCICKE